ncbi:OpgC family protein [Oceanicella actignis]|uniref:OpgC protein n=1 Tax=Oceanicella actignis TaxID=1189325 RepID=A0A1M7SEJ0_9RHOB|nr:OpgC domain-containing protein [Oceanicella actignis]SET23395.1 hypothetical protein SAMN04488119_103202 [Oceanicella actignis]SHN56891.1 hypothetical protein SAMN05216200_102306 [Oceanicella actignis]
MNAAVGAGLAESGRGTGRDPRLDFFRGLAMFIIFVAHVPNDAWALWIPARFGFSDATEIFVFCSGMASAIAFGGVFARRGWLMGTARIAHRVWQVYWAHVGLFLCVAALLYAVDRLQLGLPDKRYVAAVPIVPFFENTGEALLGLMTLRWTPNYFDILPMYLAILAMIPAMMALHRLGGRGAVAAAALAMWLAAQLGWTHLPSRPWAPEIDWFFNPFGWQLVFFTGFAFGMGWLPAPPVSRALAIAAAAVLLTALPFAWFKIHQGLYLPADWALTEAIARLRAQTEFLWWKSWVGGWRYLHFFALAYLAWLAAGPAGRRLAAPGRRAVPPAGPGRRMLIAAAAAALATAPHAYVDEIRAHLPALDALILALYGEGARALLGFDLFLPAERIGLAQLLHLAALATLVWSALGGRGRGWLAARGWPAAVRVVRKVGSQSLAVFLTSMVLAQAAGVWLDVVGRSPWTNAMVNLTGFAALIATAHAASWFKRQPWRGLPAEPAPSSAEPAPRPAPLAPRKAQPAPDPTRPARSSGPRAMRESCPAAEGRP